MNPAAGQPQPVLRAINDVFRPAGIDWDVSITKGRGDGQRLAQAAVAAGEFDAVAAYGGDGTVTEVASGLIGSQIPLIILPGGTANLMAIELGIPSDLSRACQLACNPASVARAVDMGLAGERYFMQGIGIGVQAEQVKGADRDLKNRFGILAYIVSALQALQKSRICRYHLRMDGCQVECEGLTCLILNIGNFGMSGISLAPNVDVSDGVLDIFVFRNADIALLVSVAASILDANTMIGESINHWQAHTVTVIADSTQAVQGDGEMWGETPVRARILPGAVRVVVGRNLGLPEHTIL